MDKSNPRIISIAPLFVLLVIVALCGVIVIMRVIRVGRIKKSGLLDKKPDFYSIFILCGLFLACYGSNSRKNFSFDCLKHSTTTGRNIAYLVCQTELVDSSN